jgi:TonB family protein
MQKFHITVALAITILTFSGCVIGKSGVYLSEMRDKPVLTINQDTLIVKTQNSIRNSALCTYKLNISVDNSQKKIYLSASQALCRSNSQKILDLLLYPFCRSSRNVFQINLAKHKVSEPIFFDFYWRDPDMKITKLEQTVESEKNLLQGEFVVSSSNEMNAEDIYDIVEEQPLFDGKPIEFAFHEYVQKNITFPGDDDVTGRVIVVFIIEKNGTLTNAKVIRGIHPLFDAEALRVINASPKWTPGKQNGEVVRVKLTCPVLFRLTSE